MRMGLVACVFLVAPSFAAAQGSGELWEITMAIPGMPAGMMKPQRVCQGDNPERAATQDPKKKDCKVTSSRKTASGSNVTMSCPDGSTITIDQQYNAARTEFKSTMSTKGGREGDMTMNMTGRKVGACDAQQAAKDRDAQMAAAKKQVAEGQKQAAVAMAAGAAQQKQYVDKQIKECNEAVGTMQYRQLGIYGHCYKKTTADCKSSMVSSDQMSPELAKTCNARVAEFCKRYQTQEGFVKAKADENAAQMCGVSIAAIKAEQCPRALKSQSLAFLGNYCPVEAKPIAQEHCVGRDYTSKMGGKYGEFCMAYLANNSLDKPPASTSDQVKSGINKLKGLFGR